MPKRREDTGEPDTRPAIEMWLDENGDAVRRHHSVWRGRIGVALAVLCVAVVAVPLVLVLTSAKSKTTSGARLGSDRSRHQVLAALSATIDSGSFDMTYSDQPPTEPSSATTTTCPNSSDSQMACFDPSSQGEIVAGQGTIDTDPFAMVASSDVPGIGPVTARADGTDVWEIGGGNYGLSPGSSTGPGAPLVGFASLVEGTLGPRQGALGMMGLASPTGYLELDQNAITSASQIGTGVVDGVAVTEYQVTLDPAQQANVPGATPEEATTISDALTVLQQQGYTGTTIKVSIDAAGYIRQTISVSSFADGVTQTSETTFSDFGCAGKVLMPGQSGPTAPQSGCVSPDTGSTGTTPSTTATSLG
jgi:hypothetical protein